MFLNGDRVEVKEGPFKGERGYIRPCNESGNPNHGEWKMGDDHVWVVLDKTGAQKGFQPSWRLKSNLKKV